MSRIPKWANRRLITREHKFCLQLWVNVWFVLHVVPSEDLDRVYIECGIVHVKD